MKQNLTKQTVAIYVGTGTSHSWTWFADIFEKSEFYRLLFLDEADIEDNALSNCNIFFISGGDTFAIAAGLGQKGAAKIERFVKNGGLYIGSCAGAYLPLKASIPPLNHFNFIHAPISNLTKLLPTPLRKPEKFCTEYGCKYVFHPVREEVVLVMNRLSGQAHITAPLYGGPGMLPSKDIDILATYNGFTAKTEFLVDKATATATLVGKAAVVKKNHGLGSFYLSGPHLEHPDFFDANSFLFDIISNWPSPVQHEFFENQPDLFCTKADYRRFMSTVSNARIIALSLERSSYQWQIGKKVYDPEKIRVFLETIWPRAKTLDRCSGYNRITAEEIIKLNMSMENVLKTLHQLKSPQQQADDAVETAAVLFQTLREITAGFLKGYFRYKRNCFTDEQRRKQCTQTNSILKRQRCSIPSL